MIRNRLLLASFAPLLMFGCGDGFGQEDELSLALAAADPTEPGYYEIEEFVERIQVASTGNRFQALCRLPTDGPTSGPFPAVVIAHGFQFPASQYTGYTDRLASFGYVACSVEYPANGFRPNHRRNAEDLLGTVDWLIESSSAVDHPLEGLIDATQIGLAGHSLGGKISVLAAAWDDRIKAVLGLDPVDNATNCSAANCPDATDLLPLQIPLGLIGETLDSSGGFFGQSCAPEDGNFQRFYEARNANVVEFEVLGAAHMSFLDEPSRCGFACWFCRSASASHDDIIGLSYAVTVSFFERYLREDQRYETYLTGNAAQNLWLDTGLALIRSN